MIMGDTVNPQALSDMLSGAAPGAPAKPGAEVAQSTAVKDFINGLSADSKANLTAKGLDLSKPDELTKEKVDKAYKALIDEQKDAITAAHSLPSQTLISTKKNEANEKISELERQNRALNDAIAAAQAGTNPTDHYQKAVNFLSAELARGKNNMADSDREFTTAAERIVNYVQQYQVSDPFWRCILAVKDAKPGAAFDRVLNRYREEWQKQGEEVNRLQNHLDALVAREKNKHAAGIHSNQQIPPGTILDPVGLTVDENGSISMAGPDTPEDAIIAYTAPFYSPEGEPSPDLQRQVSDEFTDLLRNRRTGEDFQASPSDEQFAIFVGNNAQDPSLQASNTNDYFAAAAKGNHITGKESHAQPEAETGFEIIANNKRTP